MKISNDGKTLLRVQDQDIKNGSFTFPPGIINIAEGAFNNCSQLISLIIPNEVENIGEAAFAGCKNLQSIVLPSSITNISDSMFAACKKLKSLHIPASVTIIGDSAFTSCVRLESITFPSGLVSIGQGAFGGTKLRWVTIPSSVTTIASHAFMACTDLQQVIILATALKIGDGVFAECTKLESLILPIGVKTLGAAVFSDSGIRSISITAQTKVSGQVGCADHSFFNLRPSDSPTRDATILIEEDNEERFNATTLTIGIGYILKQPLARQITAIQEEAYNELLSFVETNPLFHFAVLPDDMLTIINSYGDEQLKIRLKSTLLPTFLEKTLVEYKDRISQKVQEIKQSCFDEVLLSKLSGYKKRLETMIKSKRDNAPYFFIANTNHIALVRLHAIEKLMDYVSGNQMISFDSNEIEILTSGLIGQWRQRYHPQESLPKDEPGNSPK